MSLRVRRLGGNVFAEISALATKHGAVNLGQGFPSYPTPAFVKNAAVAAIQHDRNQYTRPGGDVAYVKVLAEMYEPLLQRPLDPMNEIVTFTGAQEGLAAAMVALLNPGDRVVTFEPYFDAYRTIATLFGFETIGIPFEMRPEKRAAFMAPEPTTTRFSSADFLIDLDRLDAALADPHTRLLVLNTPHNPTGKVFSRDELAGIVKVLEKHPDVLVLSDEVYEFMCFDGATHERIASFPGMFDRTLSLFSAGKTFACTGWRVGYAIGPAAMVQPIQKAHSVMPFCGATPLEVAMASCFTEIKTNGYLTQLSTELQAKRDRLVAALQEAGWKPVVPQGAYYVCCNITHLPVFQEFAAIQPTNVLEASAFPDYQCAYKLCQQHKLAVIPLSPFYTKAEHLLSPGVVRLAFCKDDKTLDDAIRIIKSMSTSA